MAVDSRIDLETRLLFQEDTIAKLNDALVDQQRQLDQLRAILTRVLEMLERPADDSNYSLEDERPPHY
jgi:SlyX protein